MFSVSVLALGVQSLAVLPPPALRPSRSRTTISALPRQAPPPPPPRPRPSKGLPLEGEPIPLSAVKAAARADARRLYEQDCGTVTLPDRAFVPVEVTGGVNPEYAVLLGRGTCAKWAQRWSGTGGVLVQFWYATNGPPRMLMERMVRGFTPTSNGVDLLQHGIYCPGGAGPNVCLVNYRWHEKDRALYPVKRTLIDGVRVKHAPRMQWEDAQIWR